MSRVFETLMAEREKQAALIETRMRLNALFDSMAEADDEEVIDAWTYFDQVVAKKLRETNDRVYA